jgi:alkanesulfonate monooxygenase SsuD/methylene tetrahydromethanopterin reductase-like flavin-dependent oxidoreductase (luciferase family)
VGFGIGWLKDEYQASNIPLNDRGKRANEYIQLTKKIWTDDVVEFRGKYYSIPASKIGPSLFKSHILLSIWEHLVQGHLEEW